MKAIRNYILWAVAVMAVLTACDKVGDLPHYGKGSAPVLSASTTTLAPAPADSNNTALTLTWTNPGYATATANVKYVAQIDTAGGNFSNPATKQVLGDSTLSFTAKELNTIALGYGGVFGQPMNLQVRLLSSYANNNEQNTSNTIALTMTPYKIPPKVALPTSNRLFIVGDATDFGWTNDATPPFPAAREFTRLDETHWTGIFNMKGSGGYKLLQTQGEWSSQFHKVSGDALSGTFEQKDADPSFDSPTEAGAYKLVFDFQTGTYTLTKVGNPVPNTLYITGDATTGGWSNTPPAAQQFTAVTNGIFEITLPLEPGKYYKFLSSSGNWQPQFGGDAAAGGALSANWGGGTDPAAVPTPAEAGNYKIQVNFITNTYTVTKV